MLRDKNIHILIIEESAPLRIALKEYFKSLGFSEIQLAKSIRDAFSIIAASDKPPNWFISSLFPEGDYNAMQLLSMMLRYKELRSSKLSLLITEEHKYYLTNAFEMGLLSWHLKNISVDLLKIDFDNLFKAVQYFSGNFTLVSSHYLRKHLTESGYIDDRLLMEKNLVALYPNNAILLVYLAEAYFLSNNVGKALSCIDGAKKLSPDVRDFADSVLKKYGHQQININKSTIAQDFEIKTVLIIDPDESIRNMLKTIFEEFGVANIYDFADGESAWEYLKSSAEPDMIIMEWKIPKISGPSLIQKIRIKGFASVAIVIHSSLVGNSDKALIREMGGSDVISKPLSHEYLSASIIDIIKQEKKPATVSALERKIRQALVAKDYINAKKYYSELEKIPHVPESTKDVLLAEFLFYEGDYLRAKELALKAMTKLSDSLFLFNLIGKILIKLGQFDLATKFLDKANAISPQNIQRLVDIAEAQSEIGNIDEANKILNNAKHIDKDNNLVQEAEMKIAFNSGQIDKVKMLMQDEEKLRSMVSYFNNKGVSLAKKGQLQESIELYNKALQCISLEKKDLYVKVKYNLALGLAKAQNLNESIKHLNDILSLCNTNDELCMKVSSLKQKLEIAIQKGAKVSIKTETKEEDDDEENFLDPNICIPFIPQIKPGEFCCYQIYSCTKGIDPRFKALVEHLPRFDKFKESLTS